MSVLSEISHRLKTDLADYARAAADPVYSRQLTEDQMRDKQFARERRAALEDAEKIRQQQIADRDYQIKLDTQKFAVGALFKSAMDDPTGKGWRRYMELNTSGNLIGPVQELSDLLANGAGNTSLEAKKQEYEKFLAFQKAKNDNIKFSMSEENRAFNELVDEKWQDDYSAAQEIMNAPRFNRQMAIDNLWNTKGIFSDEQKRSIISLMSEANDEDAKKIYSRALDSGNNEYQTRRGMLAFPERFGPALPWTTGDGEVIGTRQRGPDNRWYYTKDKNSPLVSMGDRGHAKYAFKQIEKADKSANFARKMLNSVEFLDQFVGDVETGALTRAKIGLGKLFASLNLPLPDDVDALIASETATGDIGMQLLDNFPGQISNAEREFVVNIAPGLAQTRAGRAIVSEFWRRKANRAIAYQQIMSEYLKGDAPTLFPEDGPSFNERWSEFLDTHPAYEDMPVPEGYKGFGNVPRTAMDAANQRLFYLSFDGRYRDKDGIIFVGEE